MTWDANLAAAERARCALVEEMSAEDRDVTPHLIIVLGMRCSKAVGDRMPPLITIGEVEGVILDMQRTEHFSETVLAYLLAIASNYAMDDITWRRISRWD